MSNKRKVTDWTGDWVESASQAAMSRKRAKQEILDWQSENQRIEPFRGIVCSHTRCFEPAEIMLQGYPVCAACHTSRIMRGDTVVGCAHCDPASGRWVVEHNHYEEGEG